LKNPSSGTTPAQIELARRIDAVLPQTQCTRCGFPDCAAYAMAVATAQVPLNQCPPGGAQGIARIATITGLPSLPLNPEHGQEGPRAVAVIDENWCIGCTLCIDACPTDAILGSNKQMHTVIEPYCTGCELCLPVCPVDCIQMEIVTAQRTGWAAWSAEQAQTAQQRYQSRQKRLVREQQAHEVRMQSEAQMKLADRAAHTKVPQGPGAEAEMDRKRTIIEAALAKAKARQTGA
jgi:electron transport complex protein RnfB